VRTKSVQLPRSPHALFHVPHAQQAASWPKFGISCASCANGIINGPSDHCLSVLWTRDFKHTQQFFTLPLNQWWCQLPINHRVALSFLELLFKIIGQVQVSLELWLWNHPPLASNNPC
jgi:hypothetical protein